MSGSLRVDLTELGAAAYNLAAIAAEFDTAGDNTRAVTGSIGTKSETKRLREELESFADSWKHKREEMQSDIAYLAEIAKNVAGTLTETDASLAANVSASSTPAAPSGSGAANHRQVI